MIAKHLTGVLLAGTTLLAIGTAQAQDASGTRAGTVVTNQASATYTVNGAAQTVTSNVSTFVVDRKVNLSLVPEQASSIKVNMNQAGVAAAFRLTNLTNGPQDFILDPDQRNLSLGILPGSDNFDVSLLRAYVDADGNGVYDPAIDTVQFVDELGADQSVVVFVVGDVPDSADANLAFVSMHVIVAEGGARGLQGSVLLPTDLNTINQNNEVDIVFADGDSDGGFAGDIARNGQARAYAAFEIGTRNVDLTIAKSSRIIADEINGLNPKAIPGATIEYCLIVRNATLLTPATNVTLSDVVPANTTYVPGTIQVGALGAATGCVVPGVPEDDDADDSGEIDPYRGSFDGQSRTVTALIPTLIGGGSVAASFRVTID